LWDAIQKFRDDTDDTVKVFEFTNKKDIVRNPKISRILDKYDNESNKE
jgi:phosphate starvation-inducible protein PhoH